MFWPISSSIVNPNIDSVDEQSEVQVDGLRGFELRGRCRYVDDDRACAYFHTAVFEARRFIHFTGVVPGDDLQDYLGEFRQLVQGFKRQW